jgi:hypothetical protein
VLADNAVISFWRPCESACGGGQYAFRRHKSSMEAIKMLKRGFHDAFRGHKIVCKDVRVLVLRFECFS